MDNIDHNPTATTATISFHGTSMSLFQYPTQANEGEKRKPFQIRDLSVKKVPELPETFTNIRPTAFTSKNPSPPRVEHPTNIKTHQACLKLADEIEWLDKVSGTEQLDVNLSITWPAHHASKQRGVAFDESITSLLPLLRESAHSVATIRHVMDRVKDTVAYLNPDQTPVIAADQPIYTIAKQIQWQWPNQYGEDKYVIMFGGLHIEMAAFKSIGTLLQSSGWTGALVEADLATSVTAESYLHASSVARTRQMHQVTACSLYKRLKEAYSYYCNNDDGVQQAALSFEWWCEKRKEDSPQFAFWYLVLSMELTILSLVRAFREASFVLYCQALSALIPYFFANNNTNYALWLPIHLRDMLTLEQRHPVLHHEFMSGKFVVFKSKRPFSAMAIDQAHEHANAIIKSDDGAISITDDASALRRWMVAGPEVCRLVAEYESLADAKDANERARHHNQTEHAQRAFFEKVLKLYSTMKEMGNPFQEETKDLLTLDTKAIATSAAAEMVISHHQNGRIRFKEFMKGLESEDMSSFYEPIKRNKLDFFNQKPEPVSGDLKQKVLRDDCRLFSKLFISCQSRECDLLEFFKHENQSFPAALSDGGKLHSCQKSQLASILEREITCPDNKPNATAIVIDGSALVNSLPPRAQRKFGEYATLDVLLKVQSFCSTFNRTDIVFDVYLATSLKAETRTKRGQGGRRRVTETGKIPPNWHSFLRDDDNKTELFNFLVDKIVENCTENTVLVTQKEDVLCNLQFNVEGLMPCNHEEADIRIFLHVRHAVAGGHKQVIIKANDTDVLVIAVSMFPMLCELGIKKLWISFGQGANHRWIPVHDVCREIGLEKSKGIPFFHAFTGCDVASASRGKGKKAAWQTWNVYPEASPVFTKLSMHPPVIDDEEQKVLEKFVITMFDRSSHATDIDAVRLDMFARKQRSYDTIPPTRAALFQHTKCAAYQAGCIWSQSTLRQMELESPSQWGWQQQDNSWQILWTTLPPIAESCQQLTKCGCQTECRGRCKCYKFTLPCTELCNCKCEDKHQ